MFRTDAPGHVGNLYDAGDPGAGVIPTRVSADHMNAIQEELCNLIESAGITLSKLDDQQLIAAMAYYSALYDEGHQHTKIRRNSTTQFQIGPKGALRDTIAVNNELVSVATPFTCDTTDNLITAIGADAGSGPSASTLYYAYVSNSQASFAPSDLRLSATAPTAGYLAGSGNGAHWRFVGAVATDGSTQLAADYNVCGRGVDFFEADLGADVVRSSGGSAFYAALSLADIVLLENSNLMAFAHLRGKWNVSTEESLQQQLLLNAVSKTFYEAWTPASAGNYVTSSGMGFFLSSSIQKIATVLNYFYGGSNTLTIDGTVGLPPTNMRLIRISP